MLLERHSIRRYTDRPIDGEDVKTILEAALLAPTSKNARSWQFVVVENPETLNILSQCKPSYATSIKDSRFSVIVTSDPEKERSVYRRRYCCCNVHASPGCGSRYRFVLGTGTRTRDRRRRAVGKSRARYSRHTQPYGGGVHYDLRIFGRDSQTRRPGQASMGKDAHRHVAS